MMNVKMLLMVTGTAFIWGGFLSTQAVEAKDLRDVNFAETLKIANTTLKLRGVGMITHLGFIRDNAVAFYVEEGFEARDVYDDIPKRLEFEYFHNIKSRPGISSN